MSNENKNHYHSFEIVELDKSRYVSPYRLNFNQNDRKRIWDGIMSHRSVSCIIYNKDKKCVVMVRQFRPVVYVNQVIESNIANNSTVENHKSNLDWSKVHPNEAFTFELCAGICDKDKTLEETIKEEILEECGYKVELEHIHKITDTRSGVGLLGALHTIFYAEVDEKMKVGPGGGNSDEGECIEVYDLEESKIRDFINNNTAPKTPGLLFGLIWFMHEREHYFNNKK